LKTSGEAVAIEGFAPGGPAQANPLFYAFKAVLRLF
jgi:hypothetical protein